MALILLVALGGLGGLLVAIQAYEWYHSEYHIPVIEPLSRERIQHRKYHHLALDALGRFDELGEVDRRALIGSLRRTIVPMSSWLAETDRKGFSLLCVGEDHEEHTRRFLANHIFPALRLDALHLETTPTGLADVERRIRLERGYAPLLGADIAGILDAARRKSPSLAVTAIEETERQKSDRRREGKGSREDSLVENLESAYLPGRRNAVLFGAFHCTNRNDWLYQRTRRRLAPEAIARSLNLRIIGEHQDGPLEALVYFLDEVGMEPGHFVLLNTPDFPAAIRDWFRLLWHGNFGQFDAALVFRVEPDAAR